MKLYEIYFSPTGGTKKVTEIIGSVWTCEKERIDLMNPWLEPAGYPFTASSASWQSRRSAAECRRRRWSG